jgi:predicted acetyltransferase
MNAAPDASAASPYPLRVLDDADWGRFVETDSHAFGMSVPAEVVELEREVHEPERGLGAFDGSTAVGIATAFSFDLTVPGSVLPAAGVSWVGVLPTHRRQGVLRSLMTRQLHDVHDGGREPLAVLWASEPEIYGRFGYGIASHAFSLTVARSAGSRGTSPASASALRLRLVAADDWKQTQTVYDAAAPTRPGMLARDERWWRRAVRDHSEMREGRSELRCVIAEAGGQVRGYARYATKPAWTPGRPQGTVHVREIMAVDPAARAALFGYLFDLDLMASTELWNIALDDPLLQWLRSARTATPRYFDALHVRLVDLPAALRGRTYTGPLDVVLEVRDELCPWNAGRWRLVADGGGVRCDPADGAPDLTLDVRELGAAYLGGTTLVDLGQAGRVQEHAVGSLARTSAAFRHSPVPWCPIVF